jgi:predicted regulator of Ras-like GTPase activity (Roadblock/LC7/MglB family)
MYSARELDGVLVDLPAGMQGFEVQAENTWSGAIVAASVSASVSVVVVAVAVAVAASAAAAAVDDMGLERCLAYVAELKRTVVLLLHSFVASELAAQVDTAAPMEEVELA